MWRAECRQCDFTAPHETREEAEDALIAHVQETGHQAWGIARVNDRPDSAAPDG